MDSDTEQQHKNQIRVYLKQKKLERLKQKQLEDIKRTECNENKQRSLIELKISTDLIRMKSALKDVENKELKTVSNSIYRLQMGDMDSKKEKPVIQLSESTKTFDSRNRSSLHQLNIGDVSDQASIKTDGNKTAERLSAKERWQVSPLIKVLSQQLQSKGYNTENWWLCDQGSPKYEHSTQPSLKSNSLSSLVHHAVNEFSNNPRLSISFSEGKSHKMFENPTRISAIIATHIIENSIHESTATFHQDLSGHCDHESVPSVLDYEVVEQSNTVLNPTESDLDTKLSPVSSDEYSWDYHSEV